MAEFVGGKSVVVDVGEPITFENKTDADFNVSYGVVFRKSGLYRVSVNGKHTSITIEPERKTGKWIPCNERLPEIDKDIIVTDGEICWVCSLFESQDIEDGLYQWEDNYGHWHEFESWVAWMPLPEPWKGEQP